MKKLLIPVRKRKFQPSKYLVSLLNYIKTGTTSQMVLKLMDCYRKKFRDLRNIVLKVLPEVAFPKKKSNILFQEGEGFPQSLPERLL